MLFASQSLIFGCLVPYSCSLYSKVTSYYQNHCPSFNFILMGSAMNKNEPLKIFKSVYKESKGIFILLTAVKSLFSYSIYSYSFSLRHRSGFWPIIKGNILEYFLQNHARWWLDRYSKVWNRMHYKYLTNKSAPKRIPRGHC